MPRPKTATPPGVWIKTLSGYRAYQPNPLPPEFSWTPALVRALSQADHTLGQLAGEGRRLPNPHVLIRPFIRREAVYSSMIEGTQSTLGELLAAEAGAAVERSPEDLREVGNYVVALEFGLHRLQTLPLSLRLVREIHEKLMTGVRGDHATPGQFRTSQNWIGPPGSTIMNASYVPPPADSLLDHMGRWERFMRNESHAPLAHVALLHYQFEAIHPFLDGNGRVGRLLTTLYLCARGLMDAPLLCLSAFFEATRRDYYDRLRGVTEHGDWEGWLEYFFNGVARQSEDALSRAQRINHLLTDWHKTVARAGSTVPGQIVGLLGSNPYLTVRGAQKKLSVAYNTVARAILVLEKHKIVELVGEKKRDRVFCARTLLDILQEPAWIKPGAATARSVR